MAWRYRQEHVASGDVLDPYHWVNSMNEFAAEFNGYLDRDNLRSKLFDQEAFKVGSCNEFWSAKASSDVTVNTGITSWQLTDSISTKDITVDTVGTLKVSWGATWKWTDITTTSLSNIFGGIKRLDDDVIQFRLLVNGLVIDESGPSPSTALRDSVHLCGAIPVDPGTHEIRVECRVFSWSNYHEYNPYDISATLINEASALSAGTQDEDEREVTIQDRELIVHHRKR